MREILINTLKNYKFDANSDQIEQFCKYYDLLLEWNSKVNLTAITEKSEVVYKHFLDSVLPIYHFKSDAKVIDVGSGSGFPSIPLKILRPDLNITMIDSLQKRVNFLNLVIESLNLKKIVALHERADDLAHNFIFREKFDYAIARAVASLPTLNEYLIPFVKIDGEMVAYKSQSLDEELLEATKSLQVLGAKVDKIENFSIKEISAKRKVVYIKKEAPTKMMYPRPKNKPKIDPIV